MNLRNITLGILLAAASCLAADVDGNWTGSMSTPGGDFPVNFSFKADGATLTGTTTGPEGNVKIADGKVDGSNISFSVSFDFGGMPFTMSYKGAVAKDEIKFTIDVLGMPLEVTVKRAAAALASAGSTATASIDGKWAGILSSPIGELPVTFTFKADGAKLTGTSNGPVGNSTVDNGSVEGDKVTFSMRIEYNGMPLTMTYKGVVAKDQIEFAIEVAGMPFTLLVKRAA